MASELMAGYTSYTSAPDIIAEALSGAANGPDVQSTISVTITLPVSPTVAPYTFTLM